MRLALIAATSLTYSCGDPASLSSPPFLERNAERLCADTSESCINTGVTTFDTPSGVHVIHKHVPGSAAVSMRVTFGATEYDRSPTGAHAKALALRLLRWGGPSTVDDATWTSDWTRIGGAFSTSSHLDFSTVHAEAPLPYWEDAWEWLTTALLAPSVSGMDWATAQFRASFESELDEPAAAAATEAWSALFAGHPYNRAREHALVLDSIGLEDVERSWAEWMTAGNVVAVITGDVPSEEAFALVADRLRDAVGPATQEGVAPPPPSLPKGALVLDYPESATWYVSGIFPAPAPGSPDRAALSLGTRVLSDRLFEAVRENMGLVYTINTRLAFARAGHGWLTFSSDRPLETIRLTREVLDDLLTTPPTGAELAAERRVHETRFLEGAATNQGLARSLAAYHWVAGHREHADTQFAELNAVTPDDVTRALNKHFRGLKLVAAGRGEPLRTEALLELSP